jgi:NMD protein affecting ribosome stability and mRNA decay
VTGRAKHPGRKKDRPRGVQARNLQVLGRTAKAAGAVKCTECGLVQHAGKWYRGAPPLAELHAGICPACQRVRERYPAGTIHVHPGFLEHKAEVLQIIRNVERAEKAEHPLERLMDVEESGGRLVVTTTGIHIARQIAHKLARRFHQKARIRYARQEDLIHVDWE